MNIVIHARQEVEEYSTKARLDRLIKQACAAAEGSAKWQTGQEYIYEIEEEGFAFEGVELSSFIVCHKGTGYEIYFYDGLSGETYQ